LKISVLTIPLIAGIRKMVPATIILHRVTPTSFPVFTTPDIQGIGSFQPRIFSKHIHKTRAEALLRAAVSACFTVVAPPQRTAIMIV
jgi:hypothetical protein